MSQRHLAPATLAILLAGAATANDLVSDIVSARSAVEHQNWRAAIVPLTRLSAQSPLNGEWRLNLARAHYLTGDYVAATDDYRIAYDLKAEDRGILAFGVAKCEARLKHRAEMLKWLAVADSLGFRSLQDARSDDDFAAYRGDPDYRKLVGLIDRSAVSRDDGWRTDIQFLAEWVQKKSFHPFRTATGDRILSNASYTREEFEAATRKLSVAVPALSDREIELALFQLVAKLGDGHSAIWGSPKRREFGLTLPLGFYEFDDELYVVSAAPAYANLLGAKVLAIDETRLPEALKKIAPLIGSDNPQWLSATEPEYVRHVPFLHGLGITRAENAADLRLQLPDGTKTTLHIAADLSQPDIWNAVPKPSGWRWIADGSKADFQIDNDKPWWLRWSPETGVLYLQYNKVADDEHKTLAQFADELSAAIDHHAVKKLVVDMRNNNGGNTYLNEPLLLVIAGNPKVNREGHLYVIIGRRTFSAAMNAVCYFGRMTKAIFVGEPTGGKPNSPGDETPFALPYSGIVVNLSDRYWQGGWPNDFTDWRAPDIAAAVRYSDVAAGRDAAMEVILAQSTPN